MKNENNLSKLFCLHQLCNRELLVLHQLKLSLLIKTKFNSQKDDNPFG